MSDFVCYVTLIYPNGTVFIRAKKHRGSKGDLPSRTSHRIEKKEQEFKAREQEKTKKLAKKGRK